MSNTVDQSAKTSTVPRYIRVDARDNVAIVVNQGGLTAGSRFPCGLVLTEDVPEAHKVALADVAEGGALIRYGVVIGYAKRAIACGSWVHEGLLNAPSAPLLADCPLATAVPEPLPRLEGYTFMGYRNRDGSVGTKNILGISTTVQCVAATVDYAVRRIKAELLPQVSQRGRCCRHCTPLWLRRGHRCARRRSSDSHAAESGAESKLRRRNHDREPWLRKAATGPHDSRE